MRFGSACGVVALLAMASAAHGQAPADPASPAAPVATADPAPTAAASAGGVEEIVVTAQKRSENLQKTPIAISAVTARGLQSAGITDLKGVTAVVPAVTITEYPSAASTLVTYIRGQGTGDPMIVTRDGSVGIYVDGIYLARPQTAAFDLADVERVEVLRGPQGTLYGRNTTGGAVNIISKKPTGELGIDGTIDGGNYGYHREFVNLNLPKLGQLAAKLTVVESNFDGYVKNSGKGTSTPDANNYGLKNEIGGRLAVRWTPTPDVTIDYSGDVSRSRTTPSYYVAPALVGLIPGYSADPYRTYRPIYLPKADAKTNGQALVAEWRLGSDLTLRSLSSYRHLNYFAYTDYAETFFVPFDSSDDIKSNSYTQEFQAVGDLADHRIKYALGLYYFREKANHHNTFDINASPAYLGGPNNQLILKDRQVDAVSTSKAAYGQATWTPPVLDDRLNLTVGARYTDDHRRASRLADLRIFTAAAGTTISPLNNRRFLGAGTIFDTGAVLQSNDRSFKRFNPAATIDFQATPAVNVYAKYATGYKAGGSTEGARDFSVVFGPEKATTYEVGLKSDLFDRRLRLNLAAFISKYKDLQIDFFVDPNDLSVIQIINAGSATVKGIEAEATARPFDTLTLNASYSYLHQNIRLGAPAGTIFDPAVNKTAPTPVGGDVSGYFVIPFTPKHNLNVNANWTVVKFDSGDLTLFGSYTDRGRLYATAGAGPVVPGNGFAARPSYDTLDLRLTYRRPLAAGQEVSLALWGKNVTNNHYISDFVISNGSVLTGYTNQAQPYGVGRTYGAQVGFRF